MFFCLDAENVHTGSKFMYCDNKNGFLVTSHIWIKKKEFLGPHMLVISKSFVESVFQMFEAKFIFRAVNKQTIELLQCPSTKDYLSCSVMSSLRNTSCLPCHYNCLHLNKSHGPSCHESQTPGSSLFQCFCKLF